MKQIIKNKLSKIEWVTFGKSVRRRIRIPIIACLFIGIVISAFFVFNNGRSESVSTLAPIPVFTYEHEAALNYQIHSKPNIIYKETTPEPGQVYFTKLIEYIDIFPSYEFNCDSSAQATGNYSATIYLEANNMPRKSFPMMLNIPESDFSFEHTAKLDYQVHLKPNGLYNTSTRGPGEAYFANIVDHLDITATYSYDGDGSSQSSGRYEVVGILTSSPYWQKTYVIQPQAPFDAKEMTHTISSPFTIDLDQYRFLADEINTELGIHPRETDLTIQLNVQLDAKTNNESIIKHLSPSMRIPLNTTHFTIEGELSQTRTANVPGKGVGTFRPQFTSDGTVAGFNDKFTIELTPYQEILETITDQTGVVPQEPRLVVVLDVNVTAESDKGIIIENLSPTMTIPLSPKTFEITGEFSDSHSGSIDKMDLETQSTSSESNSGPIASFAIFSIMFVGFTALTRNKREKINPFLKRLNSINRKYRDRLAEVTHLPEAPDQLTISMNSIEDLDKIAEETMKPLIYHQPNSPDGPHIYCVLDGSIRYEYTLEMESVE